MKSLISIILLLIHQLATGSTTEQETIHPETVKVSNFPIVLVVSLDGLPADMINIVDTPTLEALRAEGVHVPYMEPVFPTKTFPNHFSAVTGLYTESHGVVDNIFPDLQLNKSMNGFQPESGAFNTYNDDILPLWAGSGRVSASMLWPGGCQPYGRNQDQLLTYCEEYSLAASKELSWESRVDTVIRWMTDDEKPANLIFFYHDQPDDLGHVFGLESPPYLGMLRTVDGQISYLVKRLTDLKVFYKVNLIIMSDHGGITTCQEKIINLTSLFDQSLVETRFGEIASFNFKAVSKKKDELYGQLLQHSFSNNFTVWRKEELAKKYPFYYGGSRRVLDVVVLAHEGYVFDDFAGFAESRNRKFNLSASIKRPYGEHGYSPLVESMRATFLAHGPAFQRRGNSAPIKTVDVFPLVCSILEIPHAPNNGSWERVKVILDPDVVRGIPKFNSGNSFELSNNILFKSVLISVFLIIVS